MSNSPTAVIYFKPSDGEMAKDLSARIRNDPRNIKTLLCWGNKFRDERDVERCNAVMIQRSLHNCDLIASCYQNFSSGVEIHYVQDDGHFEDEDETGLAAGEENLGPATEGTPGAAEAGAIGTGLRRQEGGPATPDPGAAVPVAAAGEADAGKPADNQPEAEAGKPADSEPAKASGEAKAEQGPAAP